jgi:hypothetical protein
MEHSQRRASHRNRDEADIEETQAQVVEDQDLTTESDRLLDEIDEILDEVTEAATRGRSLLVVVDEELSEEDEVDPDEPIEKALWNLGLYAPSDLPAWLREELDTGVCPFCGCNPCIGWGS